MTRLRTLSGVLLTLSLFAVALSGEEAIPRRLQPGVELFDAARYPDAQTFFINLPRQSDGAWIDYFLGRIHLQNNEIDEAIGRLTDSVDADPSRSLFSLRLGNAYVQKIDRVGMLKKMGIAKKARSSFERAVELSPEDFEAREALVEYYLNAPAIAGGSRDKAEQQVVEMRKLDPTKGHLLMGRIHMVDEDWAAAAGEYRLAIENGDESSAAYYQLGFALQQDKEYQAAFRAFEEAIVTDPGALSAYYQIGRTAIFSNTNLERAVECLSFYLEQPQRKGSPGIEHAHWRLGMVYELQGKADLAAAEYRKALDLDPKHEESRKALKTLGPYLMK